MTQFLIGCDPEVFVQDADGNPVSAVGMVKGTKKEPEKVKDGAVQVDGLALELNTSPVPYTDAASFDRNVLSVLSQLKKRLPDGHNFLIKPSVNFSDKVISEAPPEALELGCEPDYNAWAEGAANPRPNASTSLRTGAGHLHIGWDKDIPVDHPDHLAVCCDFVKTLDLYVGLASIIIDPDPTRRTLYGKAGCFRPKSYGVEYRTPSNAWLRNSTTRQWIFQVLGFAINAQLGKRHYDYDGYISRVAGEVARKSSNKMNVERIINTSDVSTAHAVFTNQLGISIPTSIWKECMVEQQKLAKMG
jgi:hypothetical protein